MTSRHEVLATKFGPDVARVVETYMDQMLAVDIRKYQKSHADVLDEFHTLRLDIDTMAKRRILSVFSDYPPEFCNCLGQPVSWMVFVIELNPCVRVLLDNDETLCQGVYTWSHNLRAKLDMMGFPDFWKLYKCFKANSRYEPNWLLTTYLATAPSFAEVYEKAKARYERWSATKFWPRQKKRIKLTVKK